MVILSLSLGEQVRQALSYAYVTLRAWNYKKKKEKKLCVRCK